MVRGIGIGVLGTLLLSGGLFPSSDAHAAECPRKTMLTVTAKSSAGGTPMSGDGLINSYWFSPSGLFL